MRVLLPLLIAACQLTAAFEWNKYSAGQSDSKPRRNGGGKQQGKLHYYKECIDLSMERSIDFSNYLPIESTKAT